MTAPRSRKKQLEYLDYLKHDDSTVCSFCIIREGQDQFVEQTKHFKIIKNRFPYSLWDGQTVADHLLVTPLVHRSNLKGMSVEEKAEYVDLLEKYEDLGYNIYARAPASIIKTVPHQHTHLIKTVGSAKRFILYAKRPLIRIVH